MKIFILSTAFSGLTQRVVRELVQQGHVLAEHYGMDEALLRQQVRAFQPHAILCPFLTRRIPEDIWRNHLCLIVHPGIEGDRGPSSLDWAITENVPQWGVTLLQADAEMDAGDIWGTATFPMRRAGKTSIYKREVTTAAVALIKQALRDIEGRTFRPRPLNYSDPAVKGRCRELMRQPDRAIDWWADDTHTVVSKINAADSSPGLLDSLAGHDVYLYGARRATQLRGTPGDILAIQPGGICRATRDGAVWIRQMKCRNHANLPPIKLSAQHICRVLLAAERVQKLEEVPPQPEISDIRVEREEDTAYLYFDFYNGAASTQQCLDLRDQIRALKQTGIKTLVLMGGEDFWSNGIHLNTIEASEDPALESWENINAIDDLVLEIIDSPDQVTVAALRNNAGAGGAIMALACDEVIIRDGVVLNPHYRTMGLFGSEYWTYLLPRRVGQARAQRIVEECQPMLAEEAVNAGFADLLFPEDWGTYHKHLRRYCESLDRRINRQHFLREKAAQRARDEARKALAEYRSEELTQMRRTFYDPASEYHRARQNFVYKGKVPEELQLAQRQANAV